MSTQRFNGQSFHLDLGIAALTAKKFTLDITDNTAAAKRNGRPDGWLRGDVEASGEITVDRDGLRTLTRVAREAGSFQDIPTFDIMSYASAGGDPLMIQAFGCKLKLNKLLDVDKSSTDETEFTIPFDVTSPDFVAIDGVPYIRPEEE